MILRGEGRIYGWILARITEIPHGCRDGRKAQEQVVGAGYAETSMPDAPSRYYLDANCFIVPLRCERQFAPRQS